MSEHTKDIVFEVFERGRQCGWYYTASPSDIASKRAIGIDKHGTGYKERSDTIVTAPALDVAELTRQRDALLAACAAVHTGLDSIISTGNISGAVRRHLLPLQPQIMQAIALAKGDAT